MEDKKVAVAYTPFKTFLTTLDQLNAHGVPNIIDRSIFPSFSGTVQGQIIGALRFLDLIDDSGIPQDSLHKLVNADTETKKALLKPILEAHYKALFDADLQRLTPSQFESLFSPENIGVSGDTRKKARSFFFHALDFAGVPYSKLLTQRTRSPRRKKNGQTVNDVSKEKAPPLKMQNDTPAQNETPQTEAHPIKIVTLAGSGKQVWIGTNANVLDIKKGADRDFMLALTDLFDDYEASIMAAKKEDVEEEED